MDRQKFEELLFDDKINYFNSKLEEGLTVSAIREGIGISEKSWQREVKSNGYKYDNKLKKYINIQSTTQTNTETTTKPLEVSVVKTNTNALLTEEKSNTLDYLSNNLDILMDMIEKYRATTNSTTQTTTNKITISLIDDKHLSPKPKSIRINEFIYREWQDFCDKQYYSKMDLISMALKEYMEKYK